MAFEVGVDGRVQIGANALPIDQWTLTRNRGVADVTVFGSSFRDRKATIKDWSVSLSGTLESTNAQQLAARDQLEDGSAADIALVLMLSSSTNGKLYSGNAVVAGDVIVSSVGDKVTWQMEGQGNGALTWSPAT